MIRKRAAVLRALFAILAGGAIASSCSLPDDDYTSGDSAAYVVGKAGAGGGANGGSGGAQPFPDGGGGTTTAFPDGGAGAGPKGGGAGAPVGCGDGKKSGGEACDGTDLGGATCASAVGKPATGSLYCTKSCQLDTSACRFCGEGIKEGSEQCDGTDFGGATCASVVGVAGATGSLACTASCTIDAGACLFCGNGKREADEQCDGADLGGATCQGVVGAPASGNPTCSTACKLTSTGCQWCGDGACNNGETCTSCGDCAPCCTGACCDNALVQSPQPDAATCIGAATAMCGGTYARIKWNGNYVAPDFCQVRCNSFTTWHHVYAPDVDPPACSASAAMKYCVPHMGYTPGNIVYSACPM